jgi:hypothetical protein
LIEMRIKLLANDTRIVTDEIVLAPLVPEVAGFILDADIAGQAPIPCKFGRRGFGLSQYSMKVTGSGRRTAMTPIALGYRG